MGKKKVTQNESQDAGQIEESQESVKPKKKANAKPKPKEAPKKQIKSKPKPTTNIKNKNDKAINNNNNQQDDQEVIDKKKVFLPGQKKETPDEDDGARAFYSSLYAQNPDSQMAKRYCLQYGLLENDDAVRIQKQFAKKK